MRKQWYFFNDSVVTPVSTYRTVRANYGCSENEEKATLSNFDFLGNKEENEENSVKFDETNSSNKSEEESTNSSEMAGNGYMLIYVRHDDAPNIFAPILEENVPHHLIEYVREHANKKSKHSNSSYYDYKNDDDNVTLIMVNEDDIKLMTVEPTEMQLKNCSHKKLNKQSGVLKGADLYKKVANDYNVDIDEIRIWLSSYNSSLSKIIPNSDELVQFYTYYKEITFVIQKKDKNEPLEIPNDKIVLFLKFFFPGKEYPLQFLGAFAVKKQEVTKVLQECKDIIVKLLGIPEDTQIQAYIGT